MSRSLPISLIVACLLPLVSALASALIPRKFSWLSPLVSCALLLAMTIAGTISFFQLWGLSDANYSANWFEMGSQSIQLTWSIQPITLILFLTVTLISFLVHLFSMGYMVEDPGERRYFAMLGFFTFAMQQLVLSGNLLQLFLFWELVGFSSYMLIGHWREKPMAAAAAVKAFIMNRVGDIGLLAGLAMIWASGHTLDIEALASTTWPTWAGICIFLGVAGKSAQLPLSTWLPDAMEGPTPVSALIHAATMVAAGVFMLVRLHFIFSTQALFVITVTGMITALYGGWLAIQQFDIKKILAYSTISQLGLMVMSIGAGAWQAAYLHLFAHAFFKASLFLCAGAIIHHLHRGPEGFDPQDIRGMGGLRSRVPNVFIAFMIASAGLIGLPFFTGFLSKEAMLAGLVAQLSMSESGSLTIAAILAFFAISFLTVAYTYRMARFVFFGSFRSLEKIQHAERTPMIMVLPVAILSFGCLWFMVSPNPFAFEGWLLGGLNYDAGVVPRWIMPASLLWLAIALTISHYFFSNPLLMKSSVQLDTIYQKLLVQPIHRLASVTERTDRKWIDGTLHGLVYLQVSLSFMITWFDRTFVDGFVTGSAKMSSVMGNALRFLGHGTIQGYLRWTLAGLIIFLFWMLK